MQPQVIICKDRAEWLEARKDGLGASDAAALLGLSPWKTNVQLWEEKCGLVIPEDIGDKPYVRYGNDAEPLLRSFFALDHPEYRVSFTPYKIIKHQDLPFITAPRTGSWRKSPPGGWAAWRSKPRKSSPPPAGPIGRGASPRSITPRCASRCLPPGGSSWSF